MPKEKNLREIVESIEKGATFKNILSIKNITTLNNNIIIKNLLDIKVDDFGQFYLPSWKTKRSSGPEPEYRLNSQGFRSEEFDLVKDEEITILYSGCSWTFGNGVLQNDSWPNILSRLVEEEAGKKVKFYNLSTLGGSAYLAVKNVIGFINTYGKPDYIFINFPSHVRSFVNVEGSDHFINISTTKNPMPNVKMKKEFKKTYRRFISGFNNKDSLSLIFTLISSLDMVCRFSGIKFLWTTYDNAISGLVDNAGIESFVKDTHKFADFASSTRSDIEKYPNIDNIPYWDIGLDGEHPGAAWHQDIAKTMFSALKERNLL